MFDISIYIYIHQVETVSLASGEAVNRSASSATLEDRLLDIRGSEIRSSVLYKKHRNGQPSLHAANLNNFYAARHPVKLFAQI